MGRACNEGQENYSGYFSAIRCEQKLFYCSSLEGSIALEITVTWPEPLANREILQQNGSAHLRM